MFQRVVFGEVSDFIRGLGHHLTDMTPTEILTLAPLAALVVALGVCPRPLLDLSAIPIAVALEAVDAGSSIQLDPIVPALALGLVALVVALRIASAVRRPEPRPEPSPEAA
jgi:hypothetical protein